MSVAAHIDNISDVVVCAPDAGEAEEVVKDCSGSMKEREDTMGKDETLGYWKTTTTFYDEIEEKLDTEILLVEATGLSEVLSKLNDYYGEEAIQEVSMSWYCESPLHITVEVLESLKEHNFG